MTTGSLQRLLKTGFTLLVLCALCMAQEDEAAKIDRYIRTEMEQQKIPGLSLAVVRDGKISILKSYGLANVEHRVPVKPETVFQSGSIGKQFTAAAVMILVQDGKISLDDKIIKYFPDAPEAWKDITVWHLLTHTSGMGDYPAEINLRAEYTEEKYFEHFKKAPLNFATGTNWDYSNVGYVILGILIRKVTGMYYADLLQERVFKPLGMTTARAISEEDIVPNRAAGYRLSNGALKNQEWVSPSTNSTADGSLYFTVLDLAKWDAALYKDELLKQSSRDQIWTAVKLNSGKRKGYGFGWFTETLHRRRIVFHGGAWQGFKSFIVRFPDERLSIIFFANLWDTRDFRLARGLVSIFYPEFALPRIKTIEDKEPTVRALVRQVLLQLSKGNANRDLFTSESSIKAEQIADSLNSLSLPVAIIHSSELMERRQEGSLRVYRYLLMDIGQTLVCTVKLTGGNKIAALAVSQK
ncbi:MAG TPA: serine hydrolase domain-containing protein [Pyrinomonadaceae bacterium]